MTQEQPTPIVLETAAKWNKSGRTMAALANDYGVSRQAIQNRLRRADMAGLLIRALPGKDYFVHRAKYNPMNRSGYWRKMSDRKKG